MKSSLDVLQYAVVAMAATLPPEQAKITRAALLASLADGDAPPDPDAQATVKAMLRALEFAAAPAPDANPNPN